MDEKLRERGSASERDKIVEIEKLKSCCRCTCSYEWQVRVILIELTKVEETTSNATCRPDVAANSTRKKINRPFESFANVSMTQ